MESRACSRPGGAFDRVARMGNSWRDQRKRAVYDTSQVQTLLVTPAYASPGSRIKHRILEIRADRCEARIESHYVAHERVDIVPRLRRPKLLFYSNRKINPRQGLK